MEKATVGVWCSGIGCMSHQTLTVPGWSGSGEVSHNVYCPECYDQGMFFESQCLGCVQTFPDCGLGKLINGVDGLSALMDVNVQAISDGVCPYRVSGRFTLYNCADGHIHFEPAPTTRKAPPGSGDAILEAIARTAFDEDYYEET